MITTSIIVLTRSNPVNIYIWNSWEHNSKYRITWAILQIFKYTHKSWNDIGSDNAYQSINWLNPKTLRYNSIVSFEIVSFEIDTLLRKCSMAQKTHLKSKQAQPGKSVISWIACSLAINKNITSEWSPCRLTAKIIPLWCLVLNSLRVQRGK